MKTTSLGRRNSKLADFFLNDKVFKLSIHPLPVTSGELEADSRRVWPTSFPNSEAKASVWQDANNILMLISKVVSETQTGNT